MNITEATTDSLYHNGSLIDDHSSHQQPNNEDLLVIICERYLGPIICVCGIFGNILNMIVLFRGLLNDSPYSYLKALAITDTFALFLSLLHLTVSKKSASFEWRLFDAFIFYPLVNFFTASSVWLTVGVTIDRFVYVKAPLWARAQFSTRKAKIRIFLILIFTLIATVPRFFCYNLEQDNSSRKYKIAPSSFRSSNNYRIYDIVCIALYHVTPLIIFILANIYLIFAVEKARWVRKKYDIRNNKEKDWQIDQRRFTVTLISVVLLSIVAIFPSTISDFTRLLDMSRDHYVKLRHISNILLLCNLSMNFLFYCAFNKRFVKSMKLTFGGRYIQVKNSIRKTRSFRFSRTETNMIQG